MKPRDSMAHNPYAAPTVDVERSAGANTTIGETPLQRHIRNACVISVVWATITACGVVVNLAMDPVHATEILSAMFDVLLVYGLTFFMSRRSRIAPILLAVYFFCYLPLALTSANSFIFVPLLLVTLYCVTRVVVATNALRGL
jgi:hypothetical protein